MGFDRGASGRSVSGALVRIAAAAALVPTAVGAAALAVGLLTYATAAGGGLWTGPAGVLLLGACVGGAVGTVVGWLQAGWLRGDPGIPVGRWTGATALGLAAAGSAAAALLVGPGAAGAGSERLLDLPGWQGGGTAVLLGLAVGGAQSVCGGPSARRLRWWPAVSLGSALLGLLAWAGVTWTLGSRSSLLTAALALGGAGACFLAVTGPALACLAGEGDASRAEEGKPRDSRSEGPGRNAPAAGGG